MAEFYSKTQLQSRKITFMNQLKISLRHLLRLLRPIKTLKTVLNMASGNLHNSKDSHLFYNII